MKPQQDYYLVKFIDNTKTEMESNLALDLVIHDRITAEHHLITPNFGEIKASYDGAEYSHLDRVFFYTFGNFPIYRTSHALIHKSCIILVNGELVKEGLLVQPKKATQTITVFDQKVELKAFDIDVVVQSTVENVCVDDGIIAKRGCRYRIYIDGKEYFFVGIENILLIFCGKLLMPGMKYKLLKCIPLHELTGNWLQTWNKGIAQDGTTAIFGKHIYELTFKSVAYYLVHEDEIIGYE